MRGVKACVDRSQEKKFENTGSSPLQFSTFLEHHETIVSQLKTLDASASDFERKEAFLNWFKHNFPEIVNSNSSFTP